MASAPVVGAVVDGHVEAAGYQDDARAVELGELAGG